MTATLQISASSHGFSQKPISAIIEDRVVAFATVEEKLDALAKIWHKFNRGKSVINYSHYAYFQIVALGWAAVPFLLQEIANGDGTWYVALQYIAGETAESPEMRGNPAAVRNAWLEWGNRNGYGTKSEQA
jgi:hypothetical protein